MKNVKRFVIFKSALPLKGTETMVLLGMRKFLRHPKVVCLLILAGIGNSWLIKLIPLLSHEKQILIALGKN
ncbi:hypothetical protein J2S36_000857 [Arcanobacterium hippocoleae]|uniref:Uncharacterized protein n=1 Tax=Arcanobacterium hippocoleae TaxID=149017 RepID=A0ABU1T1R5_9ACTO|nr:hypothetical protein [Arcanobacterium hippocoleae]